MTPFRLLPILALLPLAGCAAGDRGLSSPHQPLVSAVGAHVAGCPDWSDKDLPMSEAQGANHGCATAVNLAAMIDDPRDLVRGRTDPDSGHDPAIAKSAIKSWREVGTTGKQGVDKTSSKAN